MTLASKKINQVQEGVRYASGSRTGVRVAADFTIALGFAPSHIRVVNLTDRIDALQIVNSDLDGGSNAKGLIQIATGVTTYAATGIVVNDDEKGFTVTVATAGLETADDDVYWEAWA
jgi:hypothetical protein